MYALFQRIMKGIPSEPEMRTVAKVVAEVFEDGSWCAFCGSLSQTDEEIINQGDPLTEDVAQVLFFAPRFKERPYKYRF
jgi:hypothetical protein